MHEFICSQAGSIELGFKSPCPQAISRAAGFGGGKTWQNRNSAEIWRVCLKMEELMAS